jgi:PKD repeat protein
MVVFPCWDCRNWVFNGIQAMTHYDNVLPDYLHDLSQFDHVQCRVAVNFEDASSPLNFSIQLIDEAGNTSTVAMDEYTNALFFPPGDWGTTLPRIMHNTVKIPLSAFTDVDITAVTNLRMLFNETASGAVLISDLLLSSADLVYLPSLASFTADVTETCTGIIQFTDNSSNYPEEWLWDFGDGTLSDEQNPLHAYTTNGVYTVTLTATNPAGTDVTTIVNYILVDKPASPMATGDSICPGEEFILTATALEGGSLSWYDSMMGGSAVYVGNTYENIADVTTTFYVEELVESPLQSVGPIDNTFGSGGYFNSNDFRGIFFDVLQPLTIESVKVYAGSSGMRTIQVLTGDGGDVVHSLDADIPSGESVVDLGFTMSPATGYYIKVTGELVDLFRINDGSPDYPYTIPDLISLTGSNVAGDELEYYYFFFDWQVRPASCISERSEVVALVHPLPAITISDDVTILSGESAEISATGGVTYAWSPIDFLSDPNTANPVASPEETTTYTVTVTDNNGCSDTASVVVVVDTQAGTSDDSDYWEVNLYPNPGDGRFLLLGTDNLQQAQLMIYASDGRLVWVEPIHSGSHEIDLRALPAGVYQYSLVAENIQDSGRLVIQ